MWILWNCFDVVFDRTLSWRIISIFNILYFFPWQTTYRKKKLRQRTIFLWFTGWTSGWQLKWFISCISMVVWLYIRMNIWRIAACATGRRGSSPKYLRAPFTYSWISFSCTMHTSHDKHVAVGEVELRVERKWIACSRSTRIR